MEKLKPFTFHVRNFHSLAVDSGVKLLGLEAPRRVSSLRRISLASAKRRQWKHKWNITHPLGKQDLISPRHPSEVLISAQPSLSRQHSTSAASDVEYQQGQSPGPTQREYFYYIDHQGMLFLDDARIKNFTSCFKDQKFLEFFFQRLRVNSARRYAQFPFVSLCGGERSYVRCDDVPLVYTHVEECEDGSWAMRYNHGSSRMTAPFLPQQVVMEPATGRVYHPAPPPLAVHCPVALVHTKLALQLAPSFRFDSGEDRPPTHLRWGGKDVVLTQDALRLLAAMAPLRRYSLGLAHQLSL